MENLTLVTTCKGRLSALQETLPLMLGLGAREVIVVDYACPNNTADYVGLHYGKDRVRTIKVEDTCGFNMSRARNIGADAAKTDWLLFIDADVKLRFIPQLKRFFSFSLRLTNADRCFFTNRPPCGSLSGTFCIQRRTYTEMGGCDTVINTYGAGYDEIDLYTRLDRCGYIHGYFPEDTPLFEHLRHEDRMQFYSLKDRKLSDLLNYFYYMVKLDLLGFHPKLVPELSLEHRKLLMEKLYPLFRDGIFNGKTAMIEVDANTFDVPGLKIKKTLRYALDPQ